MIRKRIGNLRCGWHRKPFVLLKEQRQLLAAEARSANIAVIGPNANDLDALEGNYTVRLRNR